MELAARLLLATNLRVSEIAYSLGYSAASNFAHEFKRHFGTSASAYRHRNHSAVQLAETTKQ
jgi:AraC-like DNA-binding protein